MLNCKMWLVLHANLMNSTKLVILPETNIGSRLPLTAFDVTHPNLAAAEVDVFTTNFTHQHDTFKKSPYLHGGMRFN